MIKREMFEHRFRQLVYVTKKEFPDSEISFRSGMWNKEEGYKYKFWDEARESLQLETWNQKLDGEIIELAMKPFGILIEGSYREQNLVSENNYLKLFDLFYERKSETVEALKEIFFGENEKAAFEKFAKILSGKSMNDPLSVASLYFFLKDKDRYVTSRKQGTTERIGMLGISAACVQKCTWDGYQQYLGIVKEIQDYLPEYLHASFLDAQSFLWMLHHVNENTPEYEEKKADDSPFVDELVIHGGTPLSSRQWEDLIREGFVTDEDIKFLAKFYANSDRVVSCLELSKNEGKHYTAYNKRAKDIGKKVSKRYGLPPMFYEDGKTDLYFPVEFLWRKDSIGNIVWHVRPELAQAMVNACPEVLGAGIEEYQQAEREEARKLNGEELHARAIASGSPSPVQYTTQTTQYRRNEYIAADAKKRAAGKCQLCGKTTFLDKYKEAYLEVHHIVWLSKGGADALENVVALCPNCHRKMHINPEERDIQKLKKIALEYSE